MTIGIDEFVYVVAVAPRAPATRPQLIAPIQPALAVSRQSLSHFLQRKDPLQVRARPSSSFPAPFARWLPLPLPPSSLARASFHAKTVRHWQLRSLICSPAPGILYYPSNDRIYSLNTQTRKRRVVASLPFSPRCIGARYGWVCAGGADRGQFATIRVSTAPVAHNDAIPADAAGAGSGSGAATPGRSFSLNAVKELGGSIVNSVTLHRPASSTSDDDVLAILTYVVAFRNLCVCAKNILKRTQQQRQDCADIPPGREPCCHHVACRRTHQSCLDISRRPAFGCRRRFVRSLLLPPDALGLGFVQRDWRG